MQHFGTNLRRLRRDRNLSQSDVARMANALAPAEHPICQAYLSLLERGMAPRDPAHVALLARVLGTTEVGLLRRPRPTRSVCVDSAEQPVAVTA